MLRSVKKRRECYLKENTLNFQCKPKALQPGCLDANIVSSNRGGFGYNQALFLGQLIFRLIQTLKILNKTDN